MKSAVTAPALILAAGLGVGMISVWSLQRIGSAISPDDADASVRAPETPAARRPTAPALILALQLGGAEADATLDAYLALPALADNASASAVQEKRNRLQALLTLLPAAHFERLLASLATHTGNIETQLRRNAFEVWTERNAAAAAKWAVALTPGGAIGAQERSLHIQQAVLVWGRDEFAAAYAWTNALADADTARDLSSRLLGQLAASDPHAALALVAGRDETFLRQARLAIFESWSERDPGAALRALAPLLIEQHSNGWAVQKTLGKWLGRDPAAALDWALAQPTWEGTPHGSLLTNIGLTVIDNPQAIRPLLDAINQRANVPGRMDMIRSLFSSWVSRSYSDAVGWLDTVTDAAQRTELVEVAIAYSSKERPEEFVALARRLPSAAQREAILSQKLSAWAKTDPEAALALLRRHQGPEFAAASRAVEGTLIATLANTDAVAAVARWEALPADASRVETATQLAKNWSQTDPAAASRWLAGQLPEKLNNQSAHQLNNALREVAAQWARSDPLAMSEWAQTLPSTNDRSLAADVFANSNPNWFYNEDHPDPPPRAAYAAQLVQIKDPEVRDEALAAHLKQWGHSDLHAACAWIESSNALTPEVAANLLHRVKNSR